MEVGKKYNHPSNPSVIYDCIKELPDNSLVLSWFSPALKRWQVQNVQPLYTKTYIEYKEPKKVYCSVWTQPSGYTLAISNINKGSYDLTKKIYLESNYVLLKEWELEYPG